MMSSITRTTAWTSALVALATLGLTGCATSQDELLPTQPGVTMSSIWHGMTGGGDRSQSQPSRLQNARSQLRRALSVRRTPDQAPPSIQTAAYRPTRAPSTVDRRFTRLPNPDLTLYVYPHMSGDGHGSSEQVPIPGYTTVFPLYQRPHYARAAEPVSSQPRRQPRPSRTPATIRAARLGTGDRP